MTNPVLDYITATPVSTADKLMKISAAKNYYNVLIANQSGNVSPTAMEMLDAQIHLTLCALDRLEER